MGISTNPKAFQNSYDRFEVHEGVPSTIPPVSISGVCCMCVGIGEESFSTTFSSPQRPRFQPIAGLCEVKSLVGENILHTFLSLCPRKRLMME